MKDREMTLKSNDDLLLNLNEKASIRINFDSRNINILPKNTEVY